MSDWLRCRGFWPQVVAFGCRRGWSWAKRVATHPIEAQREDERTAAILGAVLHTGKVVVGHLDDDGELQIQVIEESCDDG